MAHQTLVGQDLLFIKASRLRSDTTHSVGLLWKVISQKQRTLSANTHHSQDKNIYAPSGLEPKIIASERNQTHALDRAATGTGMYVNLSF
jgi:hypothetical protein